MEKPIRIVRVTHGYNMFVKNVPVVMLPSGKMSFDREKSGVGKNSKKEVIPDGARPYLFTKKEDVEGIAHSIGRYILGLGDFVDGYVEKVGFGGVEKA